MIYHITTKSAWSKAQQEGQYLPEAYPLDGFIHCSDHYQVEATANRLYRSVPDLIVVEIDPDQLTTPLVYENLEGGEMPFPHIYGPLNLDAVVSTFEFNRSADGKLKLPSHQEHPEPTLFSELPYGTPGRVFRSPTPGSHMFDPQDRVLQLFLDHQIDTIVVLNPEEEHMRHTGRTLLDRYRQADLRVIYAPIPDFSAPKSGYWDEALKQTLTAVQNGENVVIHCHAGIGRTGMFAAILTHELLGTDAEQSIEWVRKYIPYAIDTDHQKRFVRDHIARLTTALN